MKRGFILLFGILAFLFVTGNAMAYTQDLYYYKTTTATDFSMSGYANVSSDLETCNTTLQIFADITGGNGKNVEFFLYANGTQLGVPYIYSSNANATCVSVTSQTISGGDVNATARVLNLGSPVTTNLFLEIHTNCGQINNATISIFDEPTTIIDAIGRNMYNQFLSTFNDTALDIATVWNNLTPSHCELTNKKIPSLETLSAGQAFLTFVPFNSGLGTVNITGFGATGAFDSIHMGLLNLQTNAVTVLYSSTSDININSQLTITPSTDYVAWISLYTVGSSGSNPPVLNITLIDYVANYTCNTSTCANGTATRTCVDNGGISPTIIYQVSCLPEAEQIFLGFEDSDSALTARCVPSFACSGYTIGNMTVGYPTNPTWVISDFLTAEPNYNVWFAQMTGEDRSNLTLNGTIQRVNRPPMILSNTPYGSQSLKMWYIPPSPPLQPEEQTIGNATTVICGNISTGYYPYSTLSGINSSFFASFNFTFPSTLMALEFDVKRCSTPVRQYEQCGIPPLGVYESCFSFQGNCSIAPRGDYYMSLYDLTTSANVVSWQDNAPNLWERMDFDLQGNIDPTHQYQLELGVYTNDPYSSQANCVYFDNVLLINRPIAIQCTTSNACQGAERIIQQVVNGVCVTNIRQNDSSCYSQQQSQIVTGNQSLFLPIGSICNEIVNQTTNQTYCDSVKAGGYGFSLMFLTPIFWIMMFIIGMMTAVSWVTKHMEIGMGAGVLLLVGFASIFPELFFITIITIVIVGFIVGRTIVKAVQGGG